MYRYWDGFTGSTGFTIDMKSSRVLRVINKASQDTSWHFSDFRLESQHRTQQNTLYFAFIFYVHIYT